MTKFFLTICLLAIPFFLIAQEIPSQVQEAFLNEEEGEDRQYEKKHKNSAWFQMMSEPNADYFAVKNNYDTYFLTYSWEESKPRDLGESWIKTRINYLDKDGIVQDPPLFDATMYENYPVNSPVKMNATTTSVGTWTMLGPVNSANTGMSSNYNKGGYVYLNRIDPTNPQKMFSSFLTGGLWMTTDGGTNWTLTDANMPDEHYLDIDVCIVNPMVIYAISKSHVIKSIDGGLNYAVTGLTSATHSGTAYDIAASPHDPLIAVARWGDKIYRTIDGGTTWTAVWNGLPNYSIFDSSVHSEMVDWSTTENNVVYLLSTAHGNTVDLYRSDDSGGSFTNIKTITLDATANGQSVGWAKLMLPTNSANGDIYVAVGSGANAYGHHAVHLYRLNKTTGAEVSKRVNMISGTAPNELHHGDIAMDRTDENKLVFGTYSQHKIHYSTNNGASFTEASSDTHSDIRTLDFVNNKVAIGSDGETAVSTDGGVTYSTMTNSIANHELWGFGSAFKTDLIAAGLNHGPVMIKEAGSGFDWYNGPGADQQNTDVNPLDDTYIYSRGYDNYRFRRTGVHSLVNEANFLDLGDQNFFNSIEFHPNLYYSIVTHHYGGYPTGNANLAVWKNSLIRTDNNGNSIYIVKNFGNQVYREKFCMKTPSVMYVVVGLSNNAIWKTTNNGIDWTNVTPTSGESSGQTNISDIAVSDVDPNQIWVTYSGVQSACKVLMSSNGGTSYSNITEPILTDHPNTKILFQRGSNGGVYVANKSGVYYRTNGSSWAKLGNGLPMMEIPFMFINYNLGKLRIGTSRGAWEHDLAETSPPKAQISASSKKVDCENVSGVQFKDYSTVRNASAIWSWSFPGGTPATSSSENPIVSYENAPNGFYNVSLTVTDAHGSDSQTLNNFIQVDRVGCGIETVPGKVLTMVNPGDYARTNSGLNITSNTMTMSCWIKPNGAQSGNPGLITTSSGNATGLVIRGGAVGYVWGNHSYSWSYHSGLTVPEDVWSHVALAVSPTGATMYLNGTPAVNTANHGAINFSQQLYLGSDRGNNNDQFIGQMDEATIYNRTLSTDEIRELMHLTRNNPNSGTLPQTDASLIAYYQMNEGAGKPIYDKINGNSANVVAGALQTEVSTAPVGGGTFQRMNVTTGGLKDFATPGVELTFPAMGVLPDGDIIVTRINAPSDQLAATNILPNNPQSYFTVRNFGLNQNFAALTGMKFKNVQGTTNDMVSTPNTLELFKRESHNHGNTWGTQIAQASTVTNSSGTGTVDFSTGLAITSFSQFSIGVSNAALPVEILSFSAIAINNNDVFLNWETAEEINLSRYEVEQAIDGINFKKIGEVEATQQNKYDFTDKSPQKGLLYYRLKMMNNDGTFEYSAIKTVTLNGKATLSIQPNPSFDGLIGFKLEGLERKTDLSLSISNTNGQFISTRYFQDIENGVRHIFKINESGVFVVKVSLKNGQVFTEKVVISK